jgi:hypothetical protein
MILGACASSGAPTQQFVEPEFAGERSAVGGADVAQEAPASAALPQDGAAFDESVANTEAQQDIQRLIIRTGSVSLMAENTRVAQASIEAMINEMASAGAFIVNSNEYGGGEGVSPYVNMQIRVPAERFDEAMDRITALAVEGTTPTRSESGDDVTEEFVDLQARLESLESARDRLLDIMANAQTTEDLLQAEQQLTQREAEIESIKGRVQYLQQSAALSSISIDLQPYILSQPVDTRWRPAETIRRAAEALLNSLRGVGDFLIFVTIFCGPWLLVIIPVLYLLVRFVRGRLQKRREKRASQAAQGAES